MNDKISLKTKLIIGLVIVLLLVFFLLIKPFFKFKDLEKRFLNSGKRYYEINNTKLPTGKRIVKVYLKELYDKDFIDSDYKRIYTDNGCSLDNSFIRVNKKNSEYNYETYLECGRFKSKVDHSGPVIKLNGKEEITLYRNEKYEELGVSSVVDDTDGNLDVKKVEIDSSKVKTSKVGSYEVTYKIRDSYGNTSIVKRYIKVIETLNHIVSSQTKNKNIYTGSQYNNYIMLDGLVYRIIGINSDKTVKIVTDTSISAINYNDAFEYLNSKFYDSLSDSAKEYIVKSSKWCIDKVSDPKKYTKCNNYSKKYPIGLLSIIDINNSKDSSGISYLNSSTLVSNLKDSKTSYLSLNKEYLENPIDNNIIISPVLNIIEDATIISGDGSPSSPYRLKGNTKHLKPGSSLTEAKLGDYIKYSGYTWRVIGKEDDETTKIIMNGLVQKDSDNYNVEFTDKESLNFNVSSKNNIGYTLANNISKYVKTNYFVSRKEDYPKYSNTITYNAKSKTNSYKLKVNLPSLYELLSTSYSEDYYWYKEYTNDKYCYMYYLGNIKCAKKDVNDKFGVRVVAYLNKDVRVESGKGLIDNQYALSTR